DADAVVPLVDSRRAVDADADAVVPLVHAVVPLIDADAVVPFVHAVGALDAVVPFVRAVGALGAFTIVVSLAVLRACRS
ncbi:MAG: hypothetical protein KIS78_06585, partial [Labilithrix sp.]|nr:hypothetical protein [Labilithrix sp.]